MKLLDLFCGAGGAATGYYRAGFTEIVGVDICPQKRYPFEFVLGDALEYVREHGHEFDAIHASPPCQDHTSLRFITGKRYPTYIELTRALLTQSKKVFAIENVERAPLVNPILLCGTMFGLRVIRHRLFETNPPIYFLPHSCNHWGKVSGNHRWSDRKLVRADLKNFDFLTITGNDYIAEDGRRAMGIEWMTKKELSQAIPPAYTEFIGRQLLGALSI